MTSTDFAILLLLGLVVRNVVVFYLILKLAAWFWRKVGKPHISERIKFTPKAVTVLWAVSIFLAAGQSLDAAEKVAQWTSVQKDRFVPDKEPEE
jgi:hypothetical protein